MLDHTDMGWLAASSTREKQRSLLAALFWLLAVQVPGTMATVSSRIASRSLLQTVTAADEDGGADTNITLLAPFTAIHAPPEALYTDVSSSSEMLAALSFQASQANEDGTGNYLRISEDVKTLEFLSMNLPLQPGQAMVIDCQGALMYATPQGNLEQPSFEEMGDPASNTFVDLYHCILFGPPSVHPGGQSVRYNDCRVIFPCGSEVCPLCTVCELLLSPNNVSCFP